MSSTELVILGLLERQSGHGWELLRTVRLQNMSEYIRVAPSALYKALARLEDQGYIEARSEREGRRPERQAYSITRSGEARLQQLLLEHLQAPVDHSDSLTAALTFADLAPRETVVKELRQRRDLIAATQQEADRLLEEVVPPSGETFFPHLRVERWAEHLAAERRWLERAIAALEAADGEASARRDDTISPPLPTGEEPARGG
jgi:DNA-binding PadR family transcriptional regulator